MNKRFTQASPSMDETQMARSFLVLSAEQMDYLWLRSLLAHHVSSDKIQIDWSADPIEAEACLLATQFQVIFWDTAFCPQNALSYLQQLAAKVPQTQIIALGADQEAVCLDAILSAGAADYLCKGALTAWGLEKSIHLVSSLHADRALETKRSQINALTGVVNRHLFFDRLNHSLLRAHRNKELVGLMILNIDNFQSINESFGYEGGDSLIQAVATRLGKTLRESDSIARLAGDEFAIVLDNLDSFYACINVAEKINDIFQMAYLVKDEPVKVTASTGIACFPETAHSTEDLVKFANRAMQTAKQEHGNSYKYYNQTLNQKLSTVLKLEADFRKAVRHSELRLFYQPRIDISNNVLVGMESLVRWEHPEMGLLSPDEFIPMAERTGMIVPMGYWVINQACEDVARMQQLGFHNLLCSVNLSFRQFQDKKLTETFLRILFNTGVSPSNIELELTESTMMQDWEMTSRSLKEIADLGIALSLDDFGTGFSSFSHLHKLPLSTLKIDKSFIDELGSNADSQKIVNAVIQLAHNLNLGVVAEGVEDENQLQFLQYANCDHVQGYYFGKPVPYEEFLGYLDKFYPKDEFQLN